MFLYLSIGWWTEAGRFWSCKSIRHSCQMLLCWGEQTLTCSLNFFIFSSIHAISGLGKEALPTLAYTKEALHERGTYTWTLFRPFSCRYNAKIKVSRVEIYERAGKSVNSSLWKDLKGLNRCILWLWEGQENFMVFDLFIFKWLCIYNSWRD